MWNYDGSCELVLNENFKRKYICDIKGKEAILSDGLKALAHQKGIKSLNASIIQFPTQENRFTCIVEAKLEGYDWDPIQEKVVPVTYTAIGDANQENCSAMVRSSYIRMAETRAIARVCKNYTNVGIVAYEELSSAADEKVKMVDVEQSNEISSLMELKGISKEEVKNLVVKTFNKYEFNSMTYQEGKELIKILKAYEVPKATDEATVTA